MSWLRQLLSGTKAVAVRLACRHDWECTNEDLLTASPAGVRFRCTKCGKVEGL